MHSTLYQPIPGFKKAIKVSLALHIFLLIISLFNKQEEKRIFYTPVSVEILQQAVTKKEKTKKVKKQQVKKVSQKKAVKKKTKSEVKVKKEKTIDISKSISSIKTKVEKQKEEISISEKIAALKSKTTTEDEQAKSLEDIKKRIASTEEEGTSKEVQTSVLAISSKLSKAEELEHQKYFNKIHAIIKSVWRTPETGARKLETTTRLELNRDGSLRWVHILKRSGSTMYDESTIRAITKGSPFPPFPEDLKLDTLTIDIKFSPK